jgi:hypothetical protein
MYKLAILLILGVLKLISTDTGNKKLIMLLGILIFLSFRSIIEDLIRLLSLAIT